MKIVQINSVPNGSTGTIMMNIHKTLLKSGYESYVVWGRGRNANDETEICLNDKVGLYFHILFSRITGKTGFASKKATKQLINQLDEISPDIIHLHNIHGYYLNIEMLFNYIKSKNIKVIWTFHDCWPFTGHCAYFDYVKCDKWKTKCNKCPLTKSYPKSYFDNSAWSYKTKKELFSNIDDLTIVTPSKWLANLVKASFLKNNTIKVINNGIDTSIFKKLDSEEVTFRKDNNLNDKIILLGVASPWSKRKGLDDFIELAKIIDDSYKIVLVGLSKKQLASLPENILGLPRTSSVQDLVNIYNSADFFLNLTYEDNYPTTNLEALACGCKIITYNTGGSPESAFLQKKSNSIVIKSNNKKKNAKKIYEIIHNKIDENTVNINEISGINMANNYIKLYKENSRKSKV